MSLHRITLAIPLIAGGLALACGASKAPDQQSTTTTSQPPSTGNGQLALSLVDAPNTDVSKVVVNVTEVNVHHSASGWENVSTFDPPLTVDLLTLQDSAMALGLVDLPPGTITQIRLVVAAEGNYVVLPDGTTQVSLKVPSGAQSGIKLKGQWAITECNRTTLTLDFDGKKSIWYHPTGQGDLWILRPVIRVKSEAVDPVGCEPPPPTPPAPVACDPAAPACATGEVCLPSADPSQPGSFCAQPPGDGSVCTVSVECISGSCDPTTSRCNPSVPGQPCYADSDCLSSSCDLEAHACNQGAGGTPCAAASDCVSGSCGADTLVCADACVVQGLPPGATCSTNEECQSLVCADGTCGLNHEYDPCRPGSQDCDASESLFCDFPDGACIGTCMAPRVQPG